MIKGGEKMNAFLDNLLKRVAGDGKGPVTRVGFIDGATYPDGTSVAQVAAWNEYGNPGQNRPPRPFFRNMISANAPGWGVLAKKCLAASNLDGKKALDMMGEVMAGQLQQSIRDFTNPALAKSTILARAAGAKHGEIENASIGKPLIATAHMIGSVSHDVGYVLETFSREDVL
jgi:hypothetical protein